MQIEGIDDPNSYKLQSFKELLSWKIPENLSSNSNISRSRVEAEYLPPPINLYKFNMVTQRIKEQKASFVGIVMHVKQGVSVLFSIFYNYLFRILELGR